MRENTDLNFLSFNGTEICDEDEAAADSEVSGGGWRLESLMSTRPRTLGDAFSFSLKTMLIDHKKNPSKTLDAHVRKHKPQHRNMEDGEGISDVKSECFVPNGRLCFDLCICPEEIVFHLKLAIRIHGS